jgi:hypothetical protein
MSATLAISIAVLTLGSCVACYHIGREAGRKQMLPKIRKLAHAWLANTSDARRIEKKDK